MSSLNALPAHNSPMDFETADRIVGRLSVVLQEESRLKPYIAQEWIGSWSLREIIRSLYMILSVHFR